jgi:serine/threonine protein kinase
MDFGLTHAHGTDEDSSGTPAYMAPELLLGQPATIASDVYAIGVLLFNLLTMEYPVEGADFVQLRAAHASGRRRLLLDVRPDLPDALARVVETAISAAPEKRFASTGQTIAALSEAINLGSGTLERTPLKPRVLRAWILAPIVVAAAVPLLIVIFQGRAVPPRAVDRAPLASQQQDYRRAHDLLAHYYRPQALETSIPLLEQIVAQDPQFAPAFADLVRANFLQFAQQRETKYIEPARESRCARSRWRRIWRRRT